MPRRCGLRVAVVVEHGLGSVIVIDPRVGGAVGGSSVFCTSLGERRTAPSASRGPSSWHATRATRRAEADRHGARGEPDEVGVVEEAGTQSRHGSVDRDAADLLGVGQGVRRKPRRPASA